MIRRGDLLGNVNLKCLINNVLEKIVGQRC